ncbi:MAG: hypothetical protein ACRC62_09765 [Microcoleus sp.]
MLYKINRIIEKNSTQTLIFKSPIASRLTGHFAAFSINQQEIGFLTKNFGFYAEFLPENRFLRMIPYPILPDILQHQVHDRICLQSIIGAIAARGHRQHTGNTDDDDFEPYK